jgi:hypothetical protein
VYHRHERKRKRNVLYHDEAMEDVGEKVQHRKTNREEGDGKIMSE